MEFKIETLKSLQEGGTYIVELPEDMPVEQCMKIVNNLNDAIQRSNRDIVFIYIRKGDVEIKGALSYEL